DRRVAIAAIQSDISDMMLVAERHDLLDGRAHGRMRRDADPPGQHRDGEQQQSRQGAQLEREDETRLKNLGHSAFSLSSEGAARKKSTSPAERPSATPFRSGQWPPPARPPSSCGASEP